MKKSQRYLIATILPFLFLACAKQMPEQPPGTAAMMNIKTALNVGQLAVNTAKSILPSFACTAASKNGSSCLDPDDEKTAGGILDDISTVRDSLATRLAGYDHFDTKNADEIKQVARDAIATLKDLHSKGIDRIKNPQAKAQVDAVFSAVQGVVDMILNTTPPPAATA